MIAAIFADWAGKAPMRSTIGGLTLACLTDEQRSRTCDYWYAVQAHGSPHTAFRTRAALLQWIKRTGLQLARELPESLGDHAWFALSGSYESVMHFSVASFSAIAGDALAALNNGAYRAAISEALPDGRRPLHFMNCNVEQPQFDHRATAAAVDLGDDAGKTCGCNHA